MVYIVAFSAMALMALSDFFSRNKSVNTMLFLCSVSLCLCFGLLAGFRAPTVDPDYMNYFNWLLRLENNPWLVVTEPKDPGFQLLYLGLSVLGVSPVVFFALVALVSLGFKAYYARHVFSGRFAMLVFFMVFARFYIVHDFIQIRVGVAIAIASCAMLLCYDQRRWGALILYLLAISFHAAVLAMLPVFLLFFVRQISVSRFWQLAVLIGAISLSSIIPFAVQHLFVFDRIAPYMSGEYRTTDVSLFSIYFLIRLGFVVFLVLFVYQRLTDFERFLVFMSVIGLAFQIAFSWNDTLGLRLAEVFGFFDMAMLCLLLRFLNFRSRLIYSIMLFSLASIFYASSLKLVGSYAV